MRFGLRELYFGPSECKAAIKNGFWAKFGTLLYSMGTQGLESAHTAPTAPYDITRASTHPHPSSEFFLHLSGTAFCLHPMLLAAVCEADHFTHNETGPFISHRTPL
jgi:hypothetical protein